MSDSGRKRQASKEFGIRLAKALILHARADAARQGLDSTTAIIGASDYLRRSTQSARESPLDLTRTDPDDRMNERGSLRLPMSADQHLDRATARLLGRATFPLCLEQSLALPPILQAIGHDHRGAPKSVELFYSTRSPNSDLTGCAFLVVRTEARASDDFSDARMADQELGRLVTTPSVSAVRESVAVDVAGERVEAVVSRCREACGAVFRPRQCARVILAGVGYRLPQLRFRCAPPEVWLESLGVA